MARRFAALVAIAAFAASVSFANAEATPINPPTAPLLARLDELIATANRDAIEFVAWAEGSVGAVKDHLAALNAANHGLSYTADVGAAEQPSSQPDPTSKLSVESSSAPIDATTTPASIAPSPVIKQTIVNEPFNDARLSSRFNSLAGIVGQIVSLLPTATDEQTAAAFPESVGGDGNPEAIGAGAVIDSLSNTGISNPTITGGSITATSIAGTIENTINTAIANITGLTATNATTTNLVATNATSTSFYASTASFGSLAVGGTSLVSGLGLAVGPGSISIASGGSGYAPGDKITLTCTGATFTTNPVISVTATSTNGSAIVGSTLTNPGVATVVPNASCTLTQLATSGTGSGATWTATFSPIAANLSFASLSTGGGVNNGNTFLGAETPSASGLGTVENTFVGDRAGGGFIYPASANTAVGHDACGIFGVSPPTSSYNTCFGDDAGRNITGSSGGNTLIGQNAGRIVANGFNTFVGISAGSNVTAGYSNTIIGAQVGSATLTIGNHNLLIGTDSSIDAPTTGTNNYLNIENILTAINTNAPSSSISSFAGWLGVGTTSPDQLFAVNGSIDVVGGSSYYIGDKPILNASSTYSNIDVGGTLAAATGTQNTAVGFLALNVNTSGGNNTALGYKALTLNTNGAGNTAVGFQALGTDTSNNSTAVGSGAGQLTTGGQNVFLGVNAGANDTSGNDNTLVGTFSGQNLSTGSMNTFIGRMAASSTVVTGNQNILIGDNVGIPSTFASGQLNIGNFLYGSGMTGQGQTISNGALGIGTTSPYSRLEDWGPDTGSTSAFLVANSASTTEFTVLDNGNATLAGTLTQNSDERLKTNIQPLDSSSSLAAINALNPITFNWIDPNKGNTPQLGFIAQQVQLIFPNLVSTTSPTALTPDGTLSLNYIDLISPIVSAIQELSQEITSIENTISGFAQHFFSQQVSTNELCVGSTCVTPQQFAAMAAAADQSPTANATSAAVSDNSAATNTPPVIQISGDNPAIVQVGASYNDLGATITGPQADLNLGIKTFLNGQLVSNIVIDTSTAATDTIDYVATDQSGLTSTSTRTVIIQAPEPSPAVASTTSTSTSTN